MHRGVARLSWREWLVTYQDGLPACRRSPIQVLTWHRLISQPADHNSDTLTITLANHHWIWALYKFILYCSVMFLCAVCRAQRLCMCCYTGHQNARCIWAIDSGRVLWQSDQLCTYWWTCRGMENLHSSTACHRGTQAETSALQIWQVSCLDFVE